MPAAAYGVPAMPGMAGPQIVGAGGWGHYRAYIFQDDFALVLANSRAGLFLAHAQLFPVRLLFRFCALISP